MAQTFYLKEVLPGQFIKLYKTDHLTDEQLRDDFVKYLEREDYEYIEALAAEAQHRGIILNPFY